MTVGWGGSQGKAGAKPPASGPGESVVSKVAAGGEGSSAGLR